MNSQQATQPYNNPHGKTTRKKVQVFISILATILILYITIPFFYSGTTYEIPPKICVALFGEKPTIFAQHADTYFPWTNDFCLNAKVNSRGNLILKLSKKQQEKWRAQYTTAIEVLKNQDGIILSEDYTRVTLYYPSSFLTKDLIEIIQAPHGLFASQLLNGEDPSTMHILFQVVEKNSDEILYQADWPNEEFHWNADD